MKHIYSLRRVFLLVSTEEATYEFTINRSDFGVNRRGYHYQFTLTDNVGNSKSYNNDPKNENGDEGIDMLQYNLTANRIDFYDEREQRYVQKVFCHEGR